MAIPIIQPYAMPAITDVPEQKVNWELDAKRAVFLIHDMQQYFLNPYVFEQSPMTDLVKNIKRLKTIGEELNIPIIYTAQPGGQKQEDRALLTDFWGSGLADDPTVTRIIDEIAPDNNHVVLTKWRYSAFKRSNLLSIMKEQGRDQLIICGVYAHIGCLLTACDAFMEDIKPFLVADAVADFSIDYHRMALKYASERCGVTLMTDSVIAQLRKFTIENIREQVAEMLGILPTELDDYENLVDSGMDSIRIMSLVEKWRSDYPEVNFMKLVERPTIIDWWNVISLSKQVSS